MATLYITQYSRLARDNLQNAVHAGEEPGFTHTLPIGELSERCRPISDSARFVRLIADEPCHVLFGDEPIADTGCMRLPADKPELFGLARAGLRIAVIAAAP